MNLTDLIIIYLACGSPFGVYQITKRQPAVSATGWAFVVTAFLVWPAFAIASAAMRFFSEGNGDDAARHNQIEQIRTEIERLAFSDGTTVSLFEFRDVFYRFTGLFEVANAKPVARSSNELFEINGHGNKAIASRCLARRNREKLAFHQTQARNEFVDLISQLAVIVPERNEIIGLAVELANRLGDAAAMEDFEALLSEPTISAKAKTYSVTKETAKSKTHSASTIS